MRLILFMALLAMHLSANSAVLTFEEIDLATYESRVVSQIGEFTFDAPYVGGVYVSNVGDARYVWSGSNSASVGHDFGTTMRLISGGTFNLSSAYFRRAHWDYDQFTIIGYRNSEVIYRYDRPGSSLWGPNDTPMYKLTFNWDEIDQVTIWDTNVNAGGLWMDDVEYSVTAVPTPPAALLLFSGFLMLCANCRNKLCSA